MKGHKKTLCRRDETLCFDGVCTNGDYKGSTYNDLPSGKGVLYKDKYEKYNGGWLSGKRHGYGIQYKRDGYKYKGRWQHNKHHGHGELSTLDFTYTGEFRHGKYHGNGYFFMSANHHYNGIWSRGVKHKFGIYVTPAGKYEGEFSWNLKHGSGVFTDASNNVYNGQWRSDNRHGKGVYSTQDETYTGEWANNYKHGHGRLMSLYTGLYVGGWKRGQRHNKGKQIYLNGSVYNGGWSHGLKTGHGTMNYGDISEYVGFWLNDEYNGRGVLTTEKGITFTGEWNSGERDGFFQESDGEYVKTGSWVCDLRHGSFKTVKGTKTIVELYLWGTKTDFTEKKARKAVQKMLSKRDYLSAEEVLRFYPSIVKWKLFKKWDQNGTLLCFLGQKTIRQKFQKHAYDLFKDKRFGFIEKLFVLSDFCEIPSVLFDCITHTFVANPWLVGSQSYSKQTRMKLLEGLHLGEMGRCPPRDPFTRQEITESSGKWLDETGQAKSIYREFMLKIAKPEDISELSFYYDIQDFEDSIRHAMQSNDRETIQLLMKERNEFIQVHQKTQRESIGL
tara:strand:- start:2357 stop:4030 length:1674 start_codon:yes stop_codon:yes gene_type:complete